MYLLFQLKSHAYMYESTPQHIIDEESAPGPVAAWMDSSSDDSDSSSSDDSDSSSGSNTTAKRFRRVIRRRRRKSSSTSKDTADLPSNATRSPSLRNNSVSGAAGDTVVEEDPTLPEPSFGHRFGAIENHDETNGPIQQSASFSKSSEHDAHLKKERRHKKRKHHKKEKKAAANAEITEKIASGSTDDQPLDGTNEPRRVDFAVSSELEAQNQDPTNASKRAFTLRGISIRPAIPKTFSQNVFTSPAPSPHLRSNNTPPQGPIPRVRYGIRRTNSLPDRLNQSFAPPNRVQSSTLTPMPSAPQTVANEAAEDEENISRTTAVVLLLISTGLVAVCAEFMVDSINDVVSTTGLSEAFVGLIILPIVGNAAEHVTAVTVASKNKMDLAIGVAVGSSIQIGKFFPIKSPLSMNEIKNLD
jgi:Ca2+:H+ antiporter